MAKPLDSLTTPAPEASLEAEAKPFWETKTLEAMSRDEWESLCDGCGLCCLVKIEDEDTAEIYLTRLACRQLDLGKCSCKNYKRRFERVPDCISFNTKNVRELPWLPESCGYRRVAEGRGLAWWHPLVSGDRETVHQAGISVRGWATTEAGVPDSDIEHYIIGSAVPQKAAAPKKKASRKKARRRGAARK